MHSEPVRVLFLCTGNSCRSQMAEALARSLAGDRIEVHSAGTTSEVVNPLAIQTMAEVGIEMSAHRSKSIEGFLAQSWDFVITLCDRAREARATLPTAREHIHWRIDDPVTAKRVEADPLRAYRRAREDLRRRIGLLLLSNRLVREIDMNRGQRV
ncbi:MAG: arsenate reductase ArsC [Byssovorax sp.]